MSYINADPSAPEGSRSGPATMIGAVFGIISGAVVLALTNSILGFSIMVACGVVIGYLIRKFIIPLAN